jgi:MraZ protein
MDAKYRVTLPADWQPTELGRILLSPHSERDCILGLPQATYQTVIDKINASPDASEEEKYDFITYFSSINEPANIDAQGRIGLPEPLCTRFGLKKGEKVVLVGTDDRFEIYSQEEWNRRQTDAKSAFQKLSKLVRV